MSVPQSVVDRATAAILAEWYRLVAEQVADSPESIAARLAQGGAVAAHKASLEWAADRLSSWGHMDDAGDGCCGVCVDVGLLRRWANESDPS